MIFKNKKLFWTKWRRFDDHEICDVAQKSLKLFSGTYCLSLRNVVVRRCFVYYMLPSDPCILKLAHANFNFWSILRNGEVAWILYLKFRRVKCLVWVGRSLLLSYQLGESWTRTVRIFGIFSNVLSNSNQIKKPRHLHTQISLQLQRHIVHFFHNFKEVC